MNVSKKMHETGYDGEIWQRSFHDHIIRSQQDYDAIWNYIEGNPMNWDKDCFYMCPAEKTEVQEGNDHVSVHRQ